MSSVGRSQLSTSGSRISAVLVVGLAWLLSLAWALPCALGENSLTILRARTGLSYHFTDQTGTFSAYRITEGGIRVNYQGGHNSWDVEFEAPFDATLRPGIYPGAADWNDFHMPGFSISYSTDVPTTFEIKKVIYGPGREIISLWATFEQKSTLPQDDPLSGEIRFNVDTNTPATNQPPMAHAGADLRITSRDAAHFVGCVIDNGFPGAGHELISVWSVGYGPGTVAFTDPYSPVTSALFSAPGDYVLLLTAFDGEFVHSDRVHVKVLGASVETMLIIEGEKRPYTALDGEFSAYKNPFKGVSLRFVSPGPNWSLDFGAPSGAPLTEGWYENALRYPFHEDSPGLSVFGPESSSDLKRGRFEVKELVEGLNDSIVAFRASFEWQGQGEVVRRGEVYYNITKDPPPSVSIRYDTGVLPGRPTILRAEVHGFDHSSPITFNWTQLEGAKPVIFDDFGVLQPTATFPAPGIYRLRLTASDNMLKASGTITVEVAQSHSQYGGVFPGIGPIKLSLANSGSFSGHVQILSQRFSFRDEFDEAGQSVASAETNGGSPLTLNFQRANDGTILAAIVEGENRFETTLRPLSGYSHAVTAHNGTYACVLSPNENHPSFPGGDGWARVRISPAGVLQITGTLPDGTSFSRSGLISSEGYVSLMISLPGTRGVLSMHVELVREGGASVIRGWATWIKPSGAKASPSTILTGFGLVGEKVERTNQHQEPLSGAKAALNARFVYGGSLREQFANEVTLRRGGGTSLEDNVDGLAIKFAPDGIFRGRFIDRATGYPATFSGIILRSGKTGAGFFRSKGKSGYVRLHPSLSNAPQP